MSQKGLDKTVELISHLTYFKMITAELIPEALVLQEA